MMKRAVAAVALILVTSLTAVAQEDEKRIGRPDFPGILQVEWGLNIPTGDKLPVKTFGTRTTNFYYLYGKDTDSKFTVHPGIGVGLDRYQFDTDSLGRPITIVDLADSSSMVPIEDLAVRRSLFKTAYLDIPFEFRYNTKPMDPQRSLTFTLGFKAGIRMQGKSIVAYEEDSESHKMKGIHPFHLSRIRYGAYFRFGGGGFHAFASYMISPLFNEGEGHLDRNNYMLSTGISWDLF